MESIRINDRCPVEFAVSLIGGKWKLLILYQLMTHQTIRFNELQKMLTPITHRTLTRQLRELEDSGLINRVTYPIVPPKVEYSLSEKGKSLTTILSQLEDWGLNHME
ncbi:helix-turn-helix domain-containing protein [Paenibacillus polymyxa]|uniref:winged helix-turn-helix transcriptional regulator n=1 Tax=Paenibacillus polymyxa TaxID=1406 RepID=UPI002ED229B3|nr:helix-turn-helix domain-containing protein [Paenibacillus polymyxa]